MEQETETLRPVEAESVTALCDLVIRANSVSNTKLLSKTIGTLGLLVNTVTRQQNSDNLRAAFREIAQVCTIAESNRIIKAAKLGLTDELIDWLHTQLRAIAEGRQVAE